MVPATLTCSLCEVFQGVRTGERIFFDDGKIDGLLGHVAAERLEIEITQVGGEALIRQSLDSLGLPDDKVVDLAKSLVELFLEKLTEKDRALAQKTLEKVLTVNGAE